MRLPSTPPPMPLRRPSKPSDLEDEESLELTAEEVQELRRVLEERRSQLLVSIEERRLQDRDVGRDVGDEMDEASTEGASSMSSKLLERDVRLLSEIERALAKMRDGSFGLCEGTGEPIGFSRLRLRPWARYSIGYQEELERIERGRGG